MPILQNLMQQVVRDPGGDKESSSNTTRLSIGTKCIILVPTRKLALQIFQVVQSFCNHVSSQFFATSGSTSNNRDVDHCNGILDLSTTTLPLPTVESSPVTTSNFHLVAGCLSGGEKRKSEKVRLRKGIHVLVATPGRLLDHLQTTACFSWSGLRYLVMDEADRLVVDMHDAIQQIVEKLQHPTAIPSPASDTSHYARHATSTTIAATATAAASSTLQTIPVSATVTVKVQALAQDLLCLDKETNQKDRDGLDIGIGSRSDIFRQQA